MFAKKKNSTVVVGKNINSSHELALEDLAMFGIRRKVNEDLPVSKELPGRKKTKPATSRKNSVGKIVSQQLLGQK